MSSGANYPIKVENFSYSNMPVSIQGLWRGEPNKRFIAKFNSDGLSENSSLHTHFGDVSLCGFRLHEHENDDEIRNFISGNN